MSWAGERNQRRKQSVIKGSLDGAGMNQITRVKIGGSERSYSFGSHMYVSGPGESARKVAYSLQLASSLECLHVMEELSTKDKKISPPRNMSPAVKGGLIHSGMKSREVKEERA